MVNAIDIWRTADVVIKQQGEGAQLFASRRVSDLTNQGDMAGAQVWSDILAAIAVLLMREPPDSLPRQ
jgi:hypothetical protein